MKYVNYDAGGKILGYYDPDVNPVIPTGSLVITDDQWQVCINNNGKWKVDSGTLKLREKTQAELDAEIAAHPIFPDPDAELIAAIQASTTLDELKKALMGTNGKLAKVVGKMK